ncbi:MAG: PAS domain-containing sensor histidine kinase [Bacteroidales bacterium]
MDYKNLNKEELISLLETKDRFIEEYQKQKANTEDLKFAWVGNLGQWFWDVPSNIVDFNPKKATNLGYELSEIPKNAGHEFYTDKLHPDDYERVMQNMRDHLSGKTDVYEVEYRIQTKNGDYKHYYDRGKITKRDKNGKPLFLAGIVFDITHQKNIEQNQQRLINTLSEQIELKEKLFSTIFHDLRSPLSNIVSFTELLQEALNSNNTEEIDEYSNIINESATQALNITEELMEFIRAKRHPEEHVKDVDLFNLINNVVQEFKDQTKDKRIALKNEVPANVTLKTNKHILLIALRNFLSNAIKFTNKHGEIKVFYSEGEIIIKDTGTGIPAEKLETLFDGTNSPSIGTSNEPGSGIGLQLVKELLDKINVNLKIDSEVNKGTTVRLQLAG